MAYLLLPLLAPRQACNPRLPRLPRAERRHLRTHAALGSAIARARSARPAGWARSWRFAAAV